MNSDNQVHFWAGVAVTVVAALLYLIGSYDAPDKTYYQCETGEPLESEYQPPTLNPYRRDFYSSYRGDYTPKQIARSCSRQVANAYTRALACGLIVTVDDVDEGELYEGIGSSDRRTGPFFIASLGEYDADYRLMVNHGREGWVEMRMSEMPISGGAHNLKGSCEGAGFYFG